MDINLLKQLSEAAGVPGREERIREIITRETKGLFDSTEVDNMGSLICFKKSKNAGAKKVILACHIDEIGFYVCHVGDNGFLRIQSAGGFDTRNLFARRVLVQTQGGDLVGLMNPGGRPVHIAKEEDRKKIPEIAEFMVDLCIPSEEVKQKVRIGDPVTLIQPFMEIGNCVSGKCMDNRIASFVAIEALRKAKNLKYDVALAATVQEEVGCRGAGPAAYNFEPDIAIAIDVTLCVDTPGVPEEERVTKQGAGVALTVMDSSSISNRALIDEFEALAKQKDIPCQLSILPRGGTDASTMQRSRGGYKTMTFSVPTRYIHTVTETIHKRDLQAAIDLLAAWFEV